MCKQVEEWPWIYSYIYLLRYSSSLPFHRYGVKPIIAYIRPCYGSTCFTSERVPFKFHTKYLIHALRNMILCNVEILRALRLNSSYTFSKRPQDLCNMIYEYVAATSEGSLQLHRSPTLLDSNAVIVSKSCFQEICWYRPVCYYKFNAKKTKCTLHTEAVFAVAFSALSRWCLSEQQNISHLLFNE